MSETNSTHSASKPPWHRNPAIRGYIFQALLVLAVLSAGYFLLQNTLANMEKANIKTGFGFLSSEAGFGIVQSLIEYNESHTFGRTFLVGLLNTLLVSGLGIICATIIGFAMGIARLSHNWIVAKVAQVYVESVRNIPLVIQILFWYSLAIKLPLVRKSFNFGDAFFLNNRGLYIPVPVFEDRFGIVGFSILVAVGLVIALARLAKKRQIETGEQFPVFWTSLGILVVLPGAVFLAMGTPLSWELPMLKGFNFKGGVAVIPELLALLFALSMYGGAFIAEVVRAGIQSVSHGQTEAAHALGLSRGETIRLIILPQALRVIIPPLTNQYLNVTKNSSLATAVGYPDLFAVFAGTTLNQTGQAVEIIGMTMGVYLTISLSVAAFMNWYNKRIALINR